LRVVLAWFDRDKTVWKERTPLRTSSTRPTTGEESPLPPWPTRPVKLRLPWGEDSVMVATFRPWPWAPEITAPLPTETEAL